MKQVTIITINYEQSHYIRRLVESIDFYDSGIPKEEIAHIIWDNASPKKDIENIRYLAERPNTKIIESEENIWGAASTNIIVKSLETPYFLWIAPDSRIIKEGWLVKYLEIFRAKPEVSAIGLYEKHLEDCKTNPAYKWVTILLKEYGIEFDHCAHLSSTGMMVKTKVFNAIGGWKLFRKSKVIGRKDEIAAEVELTIRFRKLGIIYENAAFYKGHIYHYAAPHSKLNTYEAIKEEDVKRGFEDCSADIIPNL